MELQIREVGNRKELRKFIYLPEKIHKGHKTWVPPFYADEWKYFDGRKNKAFSYSDVTLALAWRNGEIVGRIMGIINRRYNEYRNERTARFCCLETWEDQAVVTALLNHVEEWARSHGMTRVIGPYGFSDQDPEGFLIENFTDRATIATYHNFEWMPRLVEASGYSKDIDYVVYKLSVPEEIPAFYQKIYDRVIRRGNFEVVEFTNRRELKPWIKPVLGLMNECYTESNIYGYTPLDEQEMHDLAKRYIPILDPRLVKVVRLEGEVVSFIIGMPDLTEGIQKAGGHLFPFGLFKILKAAKKTNQLDLLLAGVKEKHRGQGLDVLMGVSMLASASEAGLEILDSHHEMESNKQVRAEMERMGGVVYKRFRVYQRDL
jgi:GNAT superfamily N-acetyltransferase